MTRIHLLTTFFTHDAARLEEFRHCLRQNVGNPHIDGIVLFFEGYDEAGLPEDLRRELRHGKIRIVPVSERPAFRDFFAYANTRFAGDLVVVANTDVFFDDSLRKLKNVNFHNLFVALSRHNVLTPNPPVRLDLQGNGKTGSHDAWVFRAPLRSFHDDIRCGIIGCDAYINQKAIDAGMDVENPCGSVRVYHWHFQGQRRDVLEEGWCYWKATDYRAIAVQKRPLWFIRLKRAFLPKNAFPRWE
jgi:hypothetical protein